MLFTAHTAGELHTRLMGLEAWVQTQLVCVEVLAKVLNRPAAFLSAINGMRSSAGVLSVVIVDGFHGSSSTCGTWSLTGPQRERHQRVLNVNVINVLNVLIVINVPSA